MMHGNSNIKFHISIHPSQTKNTIQAFLNLKFKGPCLVMYSYNRNQRDAIFLKFI